MAFGFTGLLFQPFWLRNVCRIHYLNNGKAMAHLLLLINLPGWWSLNKSIWGWTKITYTHSKSHVNYCLAGLVKHIAYHFRKNAQKKPQKKLPAQSRRSSHGNKSNQSNLKSIPFIFYWHLWIAPENGQWGQRRTKLLPCLCHKC